MYPTFYINILLGHDIMLSYLPFGFNVTFLIEPIEVYENIDIYNTAMCDQ